MTMREFVTNSEAIFSAIEQGEHLVITRDGVPIAEVVPIRRQDPDSLD
ncbi:hypothetical protein [Alloactinosynnema sp. L-07]|nr:hypothetical protein [Alloactinosynnema sp. L-07]